MATTQKPLVLMTGASGFIGSHVTDRLSSDYRVVGLDVTEPKEGWAGEDWFKCDLTDDESVNRVLASIRDKHGTQVAGVIHLAAYYDFSGEPSPMYEKLTVEGSRRLIEGMQNFDRVEQFVFSSSLLVMKPVNDNDEKLTEKSPTHAEWAYPTSKLRAEEELAMHAGQIPLVMLRIAGVYDDQCHSLPISRHIARIYEKQMESYVFPGEATHGQPFLHIDDLAACFEQTLKKRGELDDVEIFLVAEPEVASHAQLQHKLGTLIHGKAWPTIRIPKAAAKAGAKAKEVAHGDDSFIKPWMIDIADDHYPVAIRRARERLDWTPKHRLLDSLPNMTRLLHRDPERFYEINKLPIPEGIGS